MTSAEEQARHRAGLAYGAGAYLWWGAVPLYFKLVASVPAFQVLCHRVVWSLVLLGAVMTGLGRWRRALDVMRVRRNQVLLGMSALLIGANWLGYIWAVSNARIVEASLGYFINPLVNTVLGFLFLRERLRPAQIACFLLAMAGVLYLGVSQGHVPYLGLMLAVTFGLYGLVRKVAHIDSLDGLALECALLMPFALAYLGWTEAQGAGMFLGHGWTLALLLVLAGPITSIPLVWFASAARRLRLATMGMLQYISPTGQFLLGVFLFNEAFTHAHGIAFGFIWVAVLLYSADALRAARVQAAESAA